MSTRLTDLTNFTDTAINDLDYFWTDEYQESTVTITIAGPAVVSWTGHGLLANTPVIFATSGSLPTGLTAGTTYYVISTGLGANSFQVSATQGGTAVNTSGTQSGTHTGKSYISKKISGAKVKSILGNVSYANTFTPTTVTNPNTITHNLATEDIIVQLWDITTDEVIYAQIDNKTTNSVDVTFDENPAGNVRVIVIAKGGAQVDFRPYYTIWGLISQSSTGAPTLIIGENTFPVTPSFARSSTGHYTITMTGQFTANKTAGTIGTSSGSVNNKQIQVIRNDVNTMDIYVWVDSSLTDSELTQAWFEIRVIK